jgi:1-acyl-sn-glycerol-3-phosphate acyltransferase
MTERMSRTPTLTATATRARPTRAAATTRAATTRAATTRRATAAVVDPASRNGVVVSNAVQANAVQANGVASNGIATNGTVGNGIVSNGAVSNGAVNASAAGNGSAGNGSAGNGVTKSGAVRKRAARGSGPEVASNGAHPPVALNGSDPDGAGAAVTANGSVAPPADRPPAKATRARKSAPAAAPTRPSTPVIAETPAAKVASANKTSAKKAPVEKAPTKKAPAKKAPATTAPAKKTAKKAVATEAPATKAAATKAAATKAPAKKAATPPTTKAAPPAQPTNGTPVKVAVKPRPLPTAPTDKPVRRRRSTPSALRHPGEALSRQVDVWDERVAGMLGFLRRRLTGEYEVDEFGFDPDLTRALVHPALRLLYRRYFRVEVSGVENLPRDGAALLVANHSGTVPMDALMLSMAVHDETPSHRHLRLLGADLVFRMPVLSELARKGGSTLACNPDAERMLRTNQLVGVFPEGFKGIGKRYADRYKLQRFGRGGFVSAALRTGTPIVPVSIVGAEEIYPIIGDLKPLARIAGLPYFPVTPLFPLLGPLGMVPLPSKWLIEFGAPIPTASYTDEADDPIVVFNLADQVRETIQHTLHVLLRRRRSVFG